MKTVLERVRLKGHPAWGLGSLSPGFRRWTGDPWGPRYNKSPLDMGTAIAIFKRGQVGRANFMDLESVKASWVQVPLSPVGLFRFSSFVKDLALSYWGYI